MESAIAGKLTAMAPLSQSELGDRLASRPEWHLDEEGPAIVRDFAFPDFAAAIVFVNRVAELAEAANHHPDVLVHGWNKVSLTLATHSEGGLTDADFRLAGEIDAVA
jgi:4a-hydroxytetrahydrobiopterin dehydratase